MKITFSVILEGRGRTKGSKLQRNTFWPKVKKNFLTVWALWQWNHLPRASASWEVLKKRLDRRTFIWDTCSEQRVVLDDIQGTFQHQHSTILSLLYFYWIISIATDIFMDQYNQGIQFVSDDTIQKLLPTPHTSAKTVSSVPGRIIVFQFWIALQCFT